MSLKGIHTVIMMIPKGGKYAKSVVNMIYKAPKSWPELKTAIEQIQKFLKVGKVKLSGKQKTIFETNQNILKNHEKVAGPVKLKEPDAAARAKKAMDKWIGDTFPKGTSPKAAKLEKYGIDIENKRGEARWILTEAVKEGNIYITNKNTKFLKENRIDPLELFEEHFGIAATRHLPGVGEQSSAAQYYKFLNKARDVSGKGPHDMDFMKETIFDVKGGEDYSKFTLGKLNKRSHEVQNEIRKIADNKNIPGTVTDGPKADLIKALHDSEVKKIQDARAIITRQDSLKKYGNKFPRLDPDNDAMIILGLDERGNPIKMGRFIGKFSATKHAETGELTRKEGTSFYDRWDSKKNRLRKVGDEVYHETLDSDSKVIMSNPDYKLPKTENMDIWNNLNLEKVNIDALAKKGHSLQDIDMLMKGRAVNKYLDAQKLKEPGLDTGVKMHERSGYNDISNVMKNLYLRNDDVFRMSIDEWIKKIPEYFASGGHVPGFATGGVSNLFRERQGYSRGKAVELITKLPEFIKFVEQLIIKASNQIRRGQGLFKKLTEKQRIVQHENLTKLATNFQKNKKFDKSFNEYFGIDAEKAFIEAQAKAERLGKGKNWKKKEVKAQAQELVSDKVVAKAYDEVFYQKPVSGDYKYDADVLAESIAEQLGKVYDDLPQAQQFEIYNIALKRVQQDLKFNMDKNKILKDVEQKMKLSDFDVTGKKGHAAGGIAGQLHLNQGGRARFQGGQLASGLMIRQNRPVQPGDPVGSVYQKAVLNSSNTSPLGLGGGINMGLPTGALDAYESGQDIIAAPEASSPAVTQAAPQYDQGTTEFLKRNPIPEEAPEWFLKEQEMQKQHWDPSWGPFESESWEEMEDPVKVHMMRELGPYDEREYTNPNAVMMPPVPMGPGIVEPMPMGPIGPMMDPDRISEIVAQQRAAGVPEEGLITNFNFAQTPPAIPLAERMQAARARGLDERMGRTYAENIQLMGDPRMHPPMGGMPIGVMPPLSNEFTTDPDAGLSGQEYAEKHNIPYAKGGRASYTKGGLANILGV